MNAKPLNIQTDSAAQDIAAAQRVLKTEQDGLGMLAAGIDGNFSAAVEIIHAMKAVHQRGGRLILSGIGKSGHVARKLAATFASTGTPSYFVHANEASHGDLGMIGEGDVVLLLSNSGENVELSDLIAFTRRFGIPLIAMTSRLESALARHADVLLLLPPAPEACPAVMAPTTSTTMMMALGDALAVVLLERTGLTPEQFKVWHPGGKLGQKLKKVSDIMHGYDSLPLVPVGAMMDKAILALAERNLGSVLIESAPGILAGIITDGDLKRHMGPDLLQKPVTAVMSKGPKTIAPEALAAEALELMTRMPGHYLTSLVVVQDGRVAGLIRVQDCLQAGVA